MGKNFYTNVQTCFGRILFRGIEDGRRVSRRIDYFPTLFVPANGQTKFTTIHGEYVEPIQPGSIKECREFIKKYDKVSNFKIYGNRRYEYSYISDTYDSYEHIPWNRESIRVCELDIEVGSENGFPDPDYANEEITAITYKMGSKFLVFGCGDYTNTDPDVKYIKCRNEKDLIIQFISNFTLDYPDIITGWNVKFFDIPYLVNRITKVMSEEFAKKLSPWKVISERSSFIMNRELKSYVLLGISILDYLELYKKFAPNGKTQPSYTLDAICHEEISERKMSYAEYGDLHRLYKMNYQKFIEYNIRDVRLIGKLDAKLKLIDLALTLAYDFRVNFDDVFTQVRMWDVGTYNELRKTNKVVPPTEVHDKDDAYVGAYVKEPYTGKYKWIVSFDLNSLYPHLIMQYNISPEKIVEPIEYTKEMHQFLAQEITVDKLLNKEIDTSILKKWNMTLTPNGQLFKIDKQGFLPKMMEDMYNDRSKYKKLSQDAFKEKELTTEEEKIKELVNTASRYHNLQLAKKVSLNSAYGALGNEYFRFFDVRQASAITTGGQLSIRWIEKHINIYLNNLLKTNNKDYVLASDTDSIYLCLDELVCRTIKEANSSATTDEIVTFLDKICESEIKPFIDKSYNELAEYLNVASQKMFMKREAIADVGIWVAKKRYILNVHWNEEVRYSKPKIKVMGLEMIKSSTPIACREKLWDSVEIIINGNEDQLINFINKFKKEYKELPVEDIAFPRGVNGIEKYSGPNNTVMPHCPIHVFGSIVYNRILKEKNLNLRPIKEGEKIKYLYVKEPNKYKTHVISFPGVLPSELDIHKQIDYNVQFEKSFIEPLKIILDKVGWKTEKKISLKSLIKKK